MFMALQVSSSRHWTYPAAVLIFTARAFPMTEERCIAHVSIQVDFLLSRRSLGFAMALC